MNLMSASNSSSQRKYLSQKNSRILLTAFFLCTIFLGYLAALSIKAASENEEFQQAMEEFQRNSSPVLADSVSVDTPELDSLNRPD